MKRYGTGRNWRNGQSEFGAKKLIALILALAVTLAMLCATAEDSDGLLLPGGTIQANDEELIIGDEAAAGDSGLELELPADAMPGEDALAIDGASLDVLEDNLFADGLSELDIGTEAPAEAKTSNESSPDDFEIDEDGVLVKYVGPGGDVVIPSGVTSIGEEAFQFCGSLTSVTIPDGVTSIGRKAFEDCDAMTSVTIPDSVTFIGEEAFCWCYRLTSVTIPDSVTNINYGVFGFCSALTSVTIPDSVIRIGEEAFYCCESLTSLKLPDSVASIGEDAFHSCKNLTTVKLGSGVSSIDPTAFGGCDNLEAINVSGKNAVYSSSDGVLYTDDQKTLLQCPEGKGSVTIPDSVVRIVDGDNPSGSPTYGGFANCKKLETVKFPDSLEYIGKFAFYNCENLKSVTVPAKVKAILTETFSGCAKLQNVTLPDGLTLIDYNAFYGCDSLESISIPQTVKKIEWGAFSWCRSLKGVTIPNSVTMIGESAFVRCENLTSVTIGSSVTSIGNEAFRFCNKLNRVTIPRSVTSIGKSAFHTVDDQYNEIPLNATIYGYKGSYAETYAKENGFKFSVLSDPISITKAKITVSSQVYTGKALKPAVTVKYGKKTLKKGTDYTVSYKNNKAIGTATVTVTGKGDYTGTAKKTFKINPKAVSGLKLTAGKGRLTASWKKAPGGISGYQLQYALKKSFSGAKKVNVAKASTVKGTLKNLKAGKTYYVRIRAFKKIGKTTYWSAWSGAKRARVK